MGRSILAVIVGYLIMAILVMASLSLAFLVVGADRAYLPGSYDISMLWLIIWALTGLGAAIAGGCVCGKIARGAKPVYALAAVVFILGSLMAWSTINKNRPQETRIAGSTVPLSEAMMKARPPDWVSIGNIVMGVVGVLLGGTMMCCCTRETPES